MNFQIGNKLKNLRKEKGWTQEQVAEQLSISQSAYARIENGDSHSWASHIKRICKIYEIAPEDLVRSEE